MEALERQRAGATLREVHDELEREMRRQEVDGEPWADVIGDDREVFERYERALQQAGYRIERSVP